MHEALAENYIKKAKEYEQASSNCSPLPGGAEQLAFALLEVARQRDDAEEMLRLVVTKYQESVFMRTADFHNENCGCLRCAMDDAADLVQKMKGRQG